MNEQPALGQDYFEGLFHASIYCNGFRWMHEKDIENGLVQEQAVHSFEVIILVHISLKRVGRTADIAIKAPIYLLCSSTYSLYNI
jgi:hypothetical protein